MKLKGCRRYFTVSLILNERHAYGHDFSIKERTNWKKSRKKNREKRIFQQTREWKTSFRLANTYFLCVLIADELIRKSCIVTRIKCELQAKRRFSSQLSESINTKKGPKQHKDTKESRGQ